MTDLFDDKNVDAPDLTVDETKNYLEELVGEGKKFKDLESLAKGKATSDAYINNLEGELAALRQELKTQATVEDLFNRLSSRQATPEIINGNTSPREPDGNDKTPEDTRQLVQKLLDENIAKQRQESNYQTVVSELEKAYGSNYQRHLNAKLAELGMGKEFATDLARTQPKAFLSLFGAHTQTSDPASGLPRGVNTAGFTPTGAVKGQKYYDNLRKEMGATKFNADENIQKQRWADIQRLGYEKFQAS